MIKKGGTNTHHFQSCLHWTSKLWSEFGSSPVLEKIASGILLGYGQAILANTVSLMVESTSWKLWLPHGVCVINDYNYINAAMAMCVLISDIKKYYEFSIMHQWRQRKGNTYYQNICRVTRQAGCMHNKAQWCKTLSAEMWSLCMQVNHRVYLHSQ